MNNINERFENYVDNIRIGEFDVVDEVCFKEKWYDVHIDSITAITPGMIIGWEDAYPDDEYDDGNEVCLFIVDTRPGDEIEIEEPLFEESLVEEVESNPTN